MNKELKLLIRNKNCTECELHESAQKVCLIGDGPVPCRLMIVGEAPGFREDDIGKPFAGRSGALLDRSLAEVGFSREEFFITNTAKCRPPDNRTPNKTEIKACRHYLDSEIEAVKPEFILTMGNTALSLIKKSGIMKHRGEVFQLDNATVLPTIHPAAVLRNPRFAGLFQTDLQTFSRLVRGETVTEKPKVYLVKDKKTLAVCCRAILKSKAVAYDFETSGFEEFAEGHSPLADNSWSAWDEAGRPARIATFSIAVKPGVAFVVPIHHSQVRWKSPERVLDAVTAALAYSPAKLVAHNAKFDDKWAHKFGKPIYADFDTMIAAHVLDENRPKGLKVLAPMLLGVDPWADVDLDNGGALKADLNKLARYNAYDADYTLRLYYKMREQLKAEGERRSLRLFVKLLMPASRCLTDIELYGMYIDQNRLAKRLLKVSKILVKIDKRLTELNGGETANWNSPPQMAAFLFGRLKLPMYDMTASGNPSTKESVLLRLRHQHEAVDLLLEWRKWSKYKGSYLERWGDVIDGRGRIHPNYKITGTVTGRLSSGKEEGNRGRGLNVQQVPRDTLIRSIIGAPPGWKFVEADFSQVELRIAAHYSGDPTLQRLYQLGEDVHLATAVDITGKPAKAITKEERKKAKGVNFGFLFGMGWKHFVEYVRDTYDVIVSTEESKAYRKRFFEKYSALPAWHKRQRRLANTYKRVQSLIGRVRHLPDIDSEDKEVQGEAERQAINSPVQSLASDMMLMAMAILHDEMPPDEAVIVGTVHDSLLFEIRDDVVDKWVPRIKEVMENLPLKKKFGVEMSVPIVVDITVGTHWGEGEAV